MTLDPGARVGVYEVADRLGAGGMGEVYRATDTRLRRSVAIKVLPDAVVGDASRLARLEREARALAALNHPNIASVYGLEDLDGSIAIVMELIDGRTLADVLVRGPLDAEAALPLARQIAEALEAAHDQSIIHRDLKPANIIVRPDGLVKVLDFGLAKVVEPPGPSDDPTMTAADATATGTAVGTPAYMSPEQARAEPVDRRTDIWAFGCVLFEMLTGRRAFGRDSSSETLAAVLNASVEWAALPADLPPAVALLLRRCLERDPRKRLRDVGEARVILEDPSGVWVAWAKAGDGAETPAHRRRSGAWMAAAGVVIGALLVWWLTATPTPMATRIETSMVLPDDLFFAAPGRRYLAISPDGLQVAFTADPGLMVRAVGDREARVVQGAPEDSRSPFFSPDSQSIGYWAEGALWQVPAAGGPPTHIVNADNPWSATWHEGGSILYGQGSDGIWRVDEDGGNAERIITVDSGESAHGPQWLSENEWVLFTLLPAGISDWNRAQIVAQSLTTDDRRVLIGAGRDARYLPSGHLVYGRAGDVHLVTFDLNTLTVGETSVTVVENVANAGNVTGAVQFDVSATGPLVFTPAVRANTQLQLTWVEPSGLETVLPGEARAFRHPRVAPQGSDIVAAVEDTGGVDLWLGDRTRGVVTPIRLDGAINSHPEWSPDSNRLAYFSSRDGGGLYTVIPANPTNTAPVLAEPDVRPAAWTADGGLLFEEYSGGQVRAVTPGAPDDDVSTFTLVPEPSYYDMLQPSLSPDGRRIAYHSLESGRTKIYVRPYPDVGRTYDTITSEVGISPVWAPDGNALYYLGGRIAYRMREAHLRYGYLMKVELDTSGPELSWTTPTRLFSLAGYVFPDGSSRQYDVADDGRFLMLKDVSGEVRPPNQIIVVQHWLDDVERRLAGR